VLESPVHSGFFAVFMETKTETGPSMFQDLEKLDWTTKKLQKTAKNQSRLVLLETGLDWLLSPVCKLLQLIVMKMSPQSFNRVKIE
jgi:hypothetical protein